MQKHHHAYLEEYAYHSKLKSMHAGLKVFFTVLVLVLCLTFNKILVSLFIIFSMTAFITVFARISFRDYFHVLFLPFIFIVFSGLVLYFNGYGMEQVMEVSSRALGAVSTFLFLVLTTPVADILAVLRKCHMPKIMIELMYLIYRFIFVLMDVWRSMSTAAQARLGFTDTRTSLQSFGKIVANLLVLSMRRASIYYDAMESRCYDGDLQFWAEKQKIRLPECVLVCGYIGVLVALFLLCI